MEDYVTPIYHTHSLIDHSLYLEAMFGGNFPLIQSLFVDIKLVVGWSILWIWIRSFLKLFGTLFKEMSVVDGIRRRVGLTTLLLWLGLEAKVF